MEFLKSFYEVKKQSKNKTKEWTFFFQLQQVYLGHYCMLVMTDRCILTGKFAPDFTSFCSSISVTVYMKECGTSVDELLKPQQQYDRCFLYLQYASVSTRAHYCAKGP